MPPGSDDRRRERFLTLKLVHVVAKKKKKEIDYLALIDLLFVFSRTKPWEKSFLRELISGVTIMNRRERGEGGIINSDVGREGMRFLKCRFIIRQKVEGRYLRKRGAFATAGEGKSAVLLPLLCLLIRRFRDNYLVFQSQSPILLLQSINTQSSWPKTFFPP